MINCRFALLSVTDNIEEKADGASISIQNEEYRSPAHNVLFRRI